jgi:flagellar basal-body rod protein FlgG
MTSQQFNLDVIANNLANVNTNGFKKSRVNFEDLMYEKMRLAGVPVAEGVLLPTGIEVGCGVKPTSTQKIFSTGSMYETKNPLDMAIEGDGFFQVLLPDGSIGYTRDGSFKRSADGRLVTSNGYILQPEIVIPEDATGISITEDGVVSVIIGGDMKAPEEVGKIELVKFANPAGLESIGKNTYKETAASGTPIVGEPGVEGFGRILQGFLEQSNVNVIEEMVSMIVAQRAYEFNSRCIQTADMMLGVANALKR